MNTNEIMTALSCLVNLAEANCLDNEIDIADDMEDQVLIDDAKYQRDSINIIHNLVALLADDKVTITTNEPTSTSSMFDIHKDNYKSNVCPHCGSTEITAYDHDFDSNWANCHIRCDECDTTWTEYFELVGVHSLEINE